MAISKGLDSNSITKSCLVTVDIANKNIEGFKKYTHIKRIHGDSLDDEVIKKQPGCLIKK